MTRDPASGAGAVTFRQRFIEAPETGACRACWAASRAALCLDGGGCTGYAEQGVMINFYLEQNQVRFEINAESATRAGLKISSKLLKLARIIKESGGEK